MTRMGSWRLWSQKRCVWGGGVVRVYRCGVWVGVCAVWVCRGVHVWWIKGGCVC